MRTPGAATVWRPEQPAVGMAIVVIAIAVSPARGESVSFRHDVMAVLSKAGCNQGACHGNANGKNGFKLSLRGEDPEADFASLTHDSLGRRVNPLQPENSLILLKATGTVPHEGGRRFDSDSIEYRIVRDWIASGTGPAAPAAPLERIEVEPAEQILFDPADSFAVRVTATFGDGTTRDVTRLACYEPAAPSVSVSPDGTVRRLQAGETSVMVRFLDRQATVRVAFLPDRSDFAWQPVPESNFVDAHVFAKLRTLRIQPSDLAPDSVFLRRVYLDTIGLLPTADEVRAFLADTRPDKRPRVIDELLERPEFADFWAQKWSDVLRNEEKTLDRKGVQAFHHWMRDALARGVPMNEFARELVASRGSTYLEPASNYYRANRNPQVRAETTAQVFLGLRLQCAKCHNHPFDRWTQNDYYGFAAFFARVQYKIVENDRKDRLDQHEFDGEQIVWMDRDGEVRHPSTNEPVPPAILGQPVASIDVASDRLSVLADWIARSDNPFFARAQVNRIWYHLMGRGIVDPIDDFRDSNPAANAALLDALAADFVSHGFNLRHTVRTILNSRTYQLSAVPNTSNADDEINFARALVRPLQAEQLLDAVCRVTETPAQFTGFPLGIRAGQLPAVRPARRRDSVSTAAEDFLKQFGKPDRLLSCECERSGDTTLGQSFQLISGATVNQALVRPDNILSRVMASGMSNSDAVEELYHRALARRPSDGEKHGAVAFLDRAADRRAALEDFLWGMLNSKEFLLRQ